MNIDATQTKSLIFKRMTRGLKWEDITGKWIILVNVQCQSCYSSAVSPPSVIIANLTTNETNHVSLNCTVSGHPSSIITWFKEGTLLKTLDTLPSLSDCSSRVSGYYLYVYPAAMGKPRTHSLVLCNTRLYNTGWYGCKAKNSIGEDDGQAYLNVQGTIYISYISYIC